MSNVVWKFCICFVNTKQMQFFMYSFVLIVASDEFMNFFMFIFKFCSITCWFRSFTFFFTVRGSRPGKNVQLTENEIRGLCLKSREIFLSQPILLELEAPLKICGKCSFFIINVFPSFFYTFKKISRRIISRKNSNTSTLILQVIYMVNTTIY